MVISSSKSYSKSNLNVVEINTNNKNNLKDLPKTGKSKSITLLIEEVIPPS